MSLNLRNYTKAVYGMDHVVMGVADDAWERPSPCDGWTAADVLTHASGVMRMIESAARGAAPEAPAGTPSEAWAATRDSVLEAFDHAGVLQQVVPSPFGEMPLDNLIGILFVDTLVHTWDLARAVGGDERLPLDLVRAGHAQLAPISDLLRGPGRFDAAIEASPGDDEQTAFLKFLGRRV
jgi:uncharacterized protein (TIGR03086 family)